MRLGIDFGGTSIRMGLVNRGGILNKIEEPCKSVEPVEEILSHLKEMIHQIIFSGVKGIGIGIPSAVDTEKGIVYKMNNIPSWKEVALKDILEQEFKVPVYVNNDANCFALGEKDFGKGRNFENFLGVCLGTGVGSGIILNNELYVGNNTFAGEFGCLPYKDSIFEHYCGSLFFTNNNTTGAKAFRDAQGGDKDALTLWDTYGYHMGNLVSAILLTHDPQAIILGGSISKAFPLFSSSMNKVLDNFIIPQVAKNVLIYASDLDDISILGASSLIK